jgi:hypothetical protein
LVQQLAAKQRLAVMQTRPPYNSILLSRSNSLKDELRSCELGRHPVERLKKVDATLVA